MADNPTIVAASLSDDELKKSVDSLVSHVEEAMKKMVTSTNNAVGEMERKLKSLGDIKVDSNGSADGGASRRTKAQNAETDAIERSNRAYKEKAVALDQMAKAQQVAIRSANPDSVRNADTLQTMRINLDLLVEKLREARNQYSAYVAMARDASTTGDKGYYQMATAGVHRYEEEVRNTIAQIRALRTGIAQMGDVIAPQGHTLQNYVNSLVKANPELAKLNDQFKRGQSLLQQQKTEFEMNAQAQRNSADATNQSKESLEALNRASERTIHEERERRDAILQTGQAARETANELIKQAYEQASTDGEDPITGAKELSEALTEMRRAYFDMSAEDKLSPIGRALEEDIKRANEAITVIQGYNKSRIGNNQQNKHEITNQSSLVSLRESLKDLTDQYNKLTLAEIAEGRGDEVIRKFQRTTRAAQMLQRTLNTPLTLADAKSSPERTLDDIIYKIQRLQAYKRVIPLDDSKSLELLDQTDREINRLNRDLNKYMSTTKQTTELNNVLGRSWAYMKNRLAFYFTVGASTAFVKNLIEVRSQYEMNERALGTLINSAERGSQIFSELSQMALVSPYTLIELSTAAKQLTAYDIAAKDVVDTTRRLADISAAVGVPVERFTYALGQVKAFGHLTSQDARQFLNTGVPLVKELAKYYTELEGRLVSTADVYDRMKKHAVSYNEVLMVLNRMTDEGGKFFDFQAKMADTLKVQLANLTLAWNNMLNDLGEQTQGMLSTSIGLLKQLFLHWKDVDNAIKTLAWTVGLGKVAQILLIANRNVKLLGKQFVWNIILTKKLTDAIVTFGKAFKAALPYLFWTTVAMAATDATMAIFGANEAQKQFNESLRKGAQDNYNNLLDFANQYKSIRDSLYESRDNGKGGVQSIPRSIDADQANKAWEAMREQIETTTSASETYISSLMRITDVSERLRQGFLIIDDIQKLNAVLKDIGDDAIKMDYDWSQWWNAGILPDGLIDNLKDYSSELKHIQKLYGDIETARKYANAETDKSTGVATNSVETYDTALQRLKADLKNSTDSLNNLLKTQGLSDKPFAVIEAYANWANKQITENTLNPDEAYALQKMLEEARAKAVREALVARLADETKAYNAATDERAKSEIAERIKTLQELQHIYAKSLDDSRPEWNNFTKYIKERHISELTAAYNKMTENGKKSLDYQSAEWQNYVHEWANSYERANGLAQDSVFNRLKQWINDANSWKIFIKMTISTEDDKSVYDTLTEADSAADNALKKINRLKTRISELRAKGTRELNANVNSPEVIEKATDDEKELMKAIKESTDAQKDYNDAIAKGGHEKEKANKKSGSGGSKKDVLGDALTKEVQLIGEIQKRYKEYQQMGVNAQEAIRLATEEYGNTLKRTNATLAKYGISTKTSEELAGMDIRDVRDYYKSLLEMAKSTGNAKGIEAIEKALASINVEITKLDYKKITDGLNNELSKLKDEYELALELDADPELGNMFAEMWGIDLDALPRTAQEYAKSATQSLNKYLKDAKTGIEIDDVLGLTDEDLGFLDDLLASESITQAAYDLIQKVVKGARDARNKEIKDSISGYDKLLEKYGGLQAKITKIYKDSVKEQIDIVRKFGDDEQVKDALDLSRQINLSQDPAEIARLQEQLAKILNDVTKGKPIALKTYQATQKQQKTQISKAYWEDFKDSDLYAMTFEDTANLSNRAIDTMIDKLEELKDKVKESPKDMEALIKAKNELEKTKNERNPFGAIVEGVEEWVNATKKVEQARERLVLANQNVAIAETQLAQAEENGLSDEVLRKQEQLNKAKKEQEEATTNVTKAENEQKKASIKVRMGMENLANSMNKIKGVFDGVSQVFRMFGDDETADAIDEISKGFSIMASMIMAVVAAMIVLESTVPWLLAIAAALGVIVGLVSFLSGQENKRIDKKIKESELAVKRLENAYRNLEATTENAYGAMVSGAQKALQANKKLQLAELQRQLTLERSRDSKHRDEDRIAELEGQIQDLRNEIKKASQDIVNDLLGISSAGDGVTSLVDAMIDAFRNGEDAMEAFSKKWDEMIDNMILKLMVSYYMQREWDKIMDTLKKMEDQFLEKPSKEYEEAVRKQSQYDNQERWQQAEDYLRSTGLFNTDDSAERRIITNLGDYFEDEFAFVPWGVSEEGMKRLSKIGITDYESFWEKASEYQQGLVDDVKRAEEATNEASLKFTEWSYEYMKGEGYDRMKSAAENLKDNIEQFYTFGQDNEKELSSLQRGISSITEETAGALEAYMNGVSQQVYYQSSLLEQIRDTVVGIDFDVQTATQAQMLLQLQQSYQVQMSIESILQGVLVPSGRAFAVEIQ